MHNYLGSDAEIIMFMDGGKVKTTTVKISQASLAGNVRIVVGKGNARER